MLAKVGRAEEVAGGAWAVRACAGMGEPRIVKMGRPLMSLLWDLVARVYCAGASRAPFCSCSTIF